MKKTLLLLTATMGNLSANANMFGNSASQLKSEIEAWFTPIISVMAIIGFGIIIGTCFIGENRDIKKGIAGIIVLVVAVLVIVAAYRFISSQTL